MHEHSERLVHTLLLACGLATLAGLADPTASDALAQQHRLAMLLMLGLALVASPGWPALRLPAIGAGVLVKLALVAVAWRIEARLDTAEAVQVVLLAAAGAWFLHQTRREARWNGALPVPQEGW